MDGIIVLLVIVIMVYGAYSLSMLRHYDKLLYGVPWLQWLTFEEIVGMGHSRFWARRLLPLFHRMRKIEIRLSDNLSAKDLARAERRGLDFATVELYEYKFTEQWRRGKKKPVKRRPLIPQLLPM